MKRTANIVIAESRRRIWHTLRLADRPLSLKAIAEDTALNSVDAEKKLEAFIREGFIRFDGQKYYPLWNGRKPRNITWEKF